MEGDEGIVRPARRTDVYPEMYNQLRYNKMFPTTAPNPSVN